jgi:hypothetical protein
MKKIVLWSLAVFFSVLISAAAQDEAFGFGFGGEDQEGFGLGGAAPAVTLGGEVSAGFTGFVKELTDAPEKTALGDIVAGTLFFSAAGSNAEGFISLKLKPVFDGSSPAALDEAYIRGFFGDLEVEAGLRKLTWGKADSMGPLDVINPLDYSDFTSMDDMAAIKIPRPLLHLSYRIGDFTKLEGVFIPWFAGHRLDLEGRWKSGDLAALQRNIITGKLQLPPDVTDGFAAPWTGEPVATMLRRLEPDPQSLQTLEYAQGGVRFTTSIGPADLGAQYFYGSLFQPAYTIVLVPNPNEAMAVYAPFLPALTGVSYNRYHQIGADYAQVIGGFNIRIEAAANITEDLAGDDGGVYNPSILCSLGFDRDLLWGLNLNLLGLGSVRLLNDKVGDPPLDTEGDTDMTGTRIILSLTKNFFRDTLEVRVSGICEIEERDFLIMPALTWTKDDLEVYLAGGIFAGEEAGYFGQFSDNSYIKVGMTYTF